VLQLVVVWLGLLALLALTASVGLMPLPDLHPLINIVIGAAKSLLIGLFFMHLRSSSTLARLLAAAGFIWLALLIGLSYSDFAMRDIAPLAH